MEHLSDELSTTVLTSQAIAKTEDVALDQYLPGIALSQIARYLRVDDLNRLLQTSSSVYWKLNRNRRFLAKTEVMLFHYRKGMFEEREAIYARIAKIDSEKLPQRNIWLLPYREEFGPLSVEERSQYSDIDKMYRDKIINGLSNTRSLHYGDNLHDTLALHSQFAFSRVNIYTLKLQTDKALAMFLLHGVYNHSGATEGLNEQQIASVADNCKKGGCRIEILHVETNEALGTEFEKLITKATVTLYVYCKPDVRTLPEDFFTWRKVHNLLYVNIFVKPTNKLSDVKIHLRDEDLALMRARTVRINAITMITPRQIVNNINEWLQFQRELENIMIGVDSTFSPKEWREQLLTIPRSRSVLDRGKEPDDPQITKVVISRQDGRVLRAYCDPNLVEIIVAHSEGNGRWYSFT